MTSGFLWQAFVTLFVIIDPFAVLPTFINLTQKESREARRKTALKACSIATVLLLVFAFIGDKLLDAMGIGEPAFRIAGGFLLLLIAIEMVVAQSSGIRSTTGDENEEAAHKEDVSVFPLAIPLIAGPGGMTSVVVLMRQAESLGWMAQVGVIGILILVLAVTYLTLLCSEPLNKLLGLTGANVLTRVFGIILAALAIQSILTGVITVIRGVIHP